MDDEPDDLFAWGRRRKAWEEAKAGAERAADHAERVEPGWKDFALGVLRLFAMLHPEATFMIEDVRAYAEARGLSPPPDPRAWGAVALQAKRDGLITRAGFSSTTRGPAHTHPRNVWRLVRG